MSTSPKVSSFYDPGAFGGWFCTLISVFIRWTGKRQSKAQDTIGNDLIPTLIYPLIAAIHYNIEVRKSSTGDSQASPEVLGATLCVVVWFTFFLPLLLWLPMEKRHLFRSVSIGIVSIACFFALVAVRKSSIYHPQFSLPMLWGTLSTMFYASHCHYISYCKCCDNKTWRSFKACEHKIRKLGKHQIETHFGLICFYGTITLFLMIAMVLVLSNTTAGDNLFAGGRIISIPQSGISVMELDQFTTLGAGILTLIYSVYDEFGSENLSPWEKYKEWKAKCEALVGNASEEDTTVLKLKENLQLLSGYEEKLLEAPTITDPDILERVLHATSE